MDRTRLRRFINQPLDEFPLGEAPEVVPSQSVRSAVAKLQDGNASCVLAMEGDRLTGIFTERDVLSRCMADGFDWDQPLSGVLTGEPQTLPTSATVGEAVATMQKLRCRTLPVLAGGKVAGVLRMGDLLRHFAEAFPEDVLNLPPRPHQVMEKQEGG